MSTSIVAPRKPRSIKAPGIKAAVLIQRANGRDKRKIARDLKIGRGTVDRIIEEANLDQQIATGRIGCANLITKAIQVVDDRLSKGSESAAFGILNPLVLNREDMGGARRMASDLTLQQTVNVLLHGGDPVKADNETRTAEKTITVEPQ